MRVSAQMPSQREWVLPQRQFRMPVKKVANTEQTEKERPLQWQPDTERYLLQIDGQTIDESQSAISCIGELHAVYPGGRRPSLKVRTFSDYFAAQLVQKDATDQGV